MSALSPCREVIDRLDGSSPTSQHSTWSAIPCSRFLHASMSVSYAEALSHIEHVASQLRSVLSSTPVTQDLDSSLGSTSSEGVYGQKTLPPLDNSAMDGYAVSSIDTVNASAENPVRLEILGSIAAGDHPPTFDLHTPSKTCFIINTGAPFPLPSSSTCSDGSQNEEIRFDACLRKEDAHPSKCGKYVDLIKPVKTMQHRRRAGEDYKRGTKLLSSGDIITPERIAALSSHGFSHLSTIRQPRIAVLSTGKELEQVSSSNERSGESSIKTPPSHIYDSNSHYILAALKTWGYEDVTRLTSLGDNPEEFEKTIHAALERRYDVLISTGGVSKGQHDYIEATLLKAGAKIHYHGTRMRPGHPALLATYSSSPTFSLSDATNHQLAVFGLPGNPCAAAATLRFMVRPFLRLSMGRCIEEPSFKARLSLSAQNEPSQKHAPNRSGVNGHHMTEKHSPNVIVSSSTASTACGSGSTSQGHRSYLLAKYDGYDEHGVRNVKTLNKGSGMIRPLSEADCWVLVKEEQSEEEGTLVDCYPISAALR